MRIFAVGTDAVGVVAIGQRATGVIAIGQLSMGVVAVGQLARGVVAIGQLAAGVFAVGQLSLGAVWSGGLVAVGPTAGFALLPIGLLGRWVPWRRRTAATAQRRERPGMGWMISAVCCVAAVVALSIVPLGRALFGSGGVFRDPPAALR